MTRADADARSSRGASMQVPGFLVQAVSRIVQGEWPGAIPAPLERSRAEPADFAVPLPDWAASLEALRTTTQTPGLGLLLGRRITEPNLHLAGPLVTASRTLQDAHAHCLWLVEAMQCHPLGQLEITPEEARYALVLPGLGRAWEDLMVSLCFHTVERFVDSFLGGASSRDTGLRAHFARAEPDEREDYAGCFGGRVRFGSDWTGVRFASSLLNRPRPGADGALADELREVVSRRLAAMRPVAPWTTRVEGALRERGDLAQVDFTHLAARWSISARTLRRRLAEEGTRLSTVLDQVRLDRASEYLRRDPSVPFARLAETLGYADESSFRRAFKRWAGVSPQVYRSQGETRSADLVVPIRKQGP